jgi:hypothetical protein
MNADVLFPPLPRALRPGAWLLARLLRIAIVATLPRWQRDLANLHQPRVIDVLIRPLMRVNFRLAAASPRLQVLILGLISPATVPIAAPMLLGLKPRQEQTLTPAESYERHGVPTPKALYEQLAADQGTILYPPSVPVPAAPGPAALPAG